MPGKEAPLGTTVEKILGRLLTLAFRESEWLGRQRDPHKISRAAIAPWGK
jgi:hypothetical protein